MTQHDPTVRLRHMLDHAREAVDLADGLERAQLDDDRRLELALTHLVQIIGEAAARVAPEIRARHPDIAWEDIVGTRHRMVHDYENVDLNILWRIVKEELPPLIEALERVIRREADA